MELNRYPDNYFAEVEQAALSRAVGHPATNLLLFGASLIASHGQSHLWSQTSPTGLAPKRLSLTCTTKTRSPSNGLSPLTRFGFGQTLPLQGSADFMRRTLDSRD